MNEEGMLGKINIKRKKGSEFFYDVTIAALKDSLYATFFFLLLRLVFLFVYLSKLIAVPVRRARTKIKKKKEQIELK